MNEIVTELVELACGHARLNVRRDEVERFGRQAAGAAHALEAFRTVQLDGALVAAPIVDAVVFEIAGGIHRPYLACGTRSHKAVLGC